ncbi:MAG: apolipoprotein N-acyltransferase [Legionella sp.]|nr:apolipoprotein N-acyltransferase [Legionella sp.]
MNQTYTSNSVWFHKILSQITASSTSTQILRAFASGLLLPLGFAPFHLPGLAILSLALLFLQLTHQSPKKAFLIAFSFGAGFLGLGTSWIYNSIHIYGNLNIPLSIALTLLFVAAFSLYPAFFGLIYAKINQKLPVFLSPFLFASLWLFAEYCRANSFTGFPWLLVGFGQMDSPLQHLLPIIGVFGVSGFTALASGFLGLAIHQKNKYKFIWLTGFVLILILPISLKHKAWTQVHHEPVSVGVIQADLSMRDKWDGALYQTIQDYYQEQITALLPKKNLVILPESAIPLPSSYAGDFLDAIDTEARDNHSAILLGIPHPSDTDPGRYHNALLTLGEARGVYLKQHLVPFGEYIPKRFLKLTGAINLPDPNMAKGSTHQAPVMLHQYPIAALICYELAYPDLIRTQFPQAAFITSLSDDGWFGHSFAMYQHLQMAQVISKQTGRYQIFSNNNGRSSLIDAQGKILNHLPAFSKGVLEGMIYPATGTTPWIQTGDTWVLNGTIILLLLIIGCRLLLAAREKRRYPNQPSSMC